MKTIAPGATGSFSLIVRPEHLANQFKDSILPPVLATPVMVMIMENAALNALKAYLEPGESALGTHVDVKHLAATPAGRRVAGEAELIGVEGRRLRFRVRATDEAGVIGEGLHERMVIRLDKFMDRLQSR